MNIEINVVFSLVLHCFTLHHFQDQSKEDQNQPRLQGLLRFKNGGTGVAKNPPRIVEYLVRDIP